MKRNMLQIIVACVFLFFASFANTLHAQSVTTGGAIKPGKETGVWPVAKNTARPLTRWWWMGNAVDGKNINELLKEYAAIGIGGVEIVPIYGAKGYEARYIDYLSPKWMKVLDTTIRAAKKLNMLVDISIGSGWPIGGPDVGLQDAAVKMELQQYRLKPGEKLDKKIENQNKLLTGNQYTKPVALMAYSNSGKLSDIAKFLGSDGVLNWSPAQEDWTILALFNSRTLQKVKRAAPGGEGYTLDHFSGRAVNNYISYFDKHFGSQGRGLRSLYNDSYEVFNADWSDDFLKEFERLRGYDLKPYLLQLASPKTNNELTARVKSDYRETMSDLILNNFTRRMASWSHSKNLVFLNQAHGSPGNLLDLYAAVDIPETETFGSAIYAIPGLMRDMYDPRIADTEPLMFKFASSAAHVMGHPYVSSETHTWLTEHFKTNLALCKPEAENLFLSGVNQLMFHGTTYSPRDVPWPGWLFYASVNFTPANSLWPALKGYNDYITRCQSVLQAGSPDNEILLYWPVYDLWNDTEGIDLPFRAHNTHVWIHGTDLYQKSLLLKKEGYSFDYVSDEMIQKATLIGKDIVIAKAGATYKTIVVPACKMMAGASFEKLLNLAASGATVIFNNLPEDVPGLPQLAERREKLSALKSSLNKVLQNGAANWGKGRIVVTSQLLPALRSAGLKGESIAATGLQFIRRKVTDGYYYFIVNHSAAEIDSWITLNNKAAHTNLLDPQSGYSGRPQVKNLSGEQATRIQLKPGESLIVRLSNPASATDDWKYVSETGRSIRLESNWRLRFTGGGPSLPPAIAADPLKLWTDYADTAYQYFSGTGVYSTLLQLDKKAGKEYLLQLEGLYEAARVKINGEMAGYIYSVPYELRIGKFLKRGANTIEIEVNNLMANRIRYMDRNKISWRNYHEINFVNKDYKAFDASNWKVMPSGLAGPVRLLEF